MPARATVLATKEKAAIENPDAGLLEGKSTCNDPIEESDTCTLTGTNVACSSWAGVYAAGSCYFYAFGSVHCPALGGLYLYQTTSDPNCLSWCGSC